MNNPVFQNLSATNKKLKNKIVKADPNTLILGQL